jgi:hypothetical protein
MEVEGSCEYDKAAGYDWNSIYQKSEMKRCDTSNPKEKRQLLQLLP